MESIIGWSRRDAEGRRLNSRERKTGGDDAPAQGSKGELKKHLEN
jgi:hypothetical protein